MKNPSSSSSSTTPTTTTTTTKKRTTPCCSKVGIKRGPWTPEEDQLLVNYIKKEGEGGWRALPKKAGLLRCGKSCRLRWMNYLRPNVKRGRIDPDEEDLILRLHRLLGNRWSMIAGRIPGRTDNEIKNYWNTHLSKKLISQGIDPRTHKPLIINPSAPNISSSQNSDQFRHSIKRPGPSNYSFHIQGSSKTYRAVAQKVSGNFKMANLDRIDESQNQVLRNEGIVSQDWPDYQDGFFVGLQHGNGESNEADYINIGNANDDTFSSLFDSLINDNVFGNQQLQQQQQTHVLAASGQFQDISPSTQAFDQSTIWEAEVMSSMEALGGEEDGLTSHNLHKSI